ncbi:MAG: hypothetical protein Q9186_006261 [Xanthomendoza sp. 1 TL-2023]
MSNPKVHQENEAKRRVGARRAFDAMLAAIPGTPTQSYKADKIEYCADWMRKSIDENNELAALLQAHNQQQQQQQPNAQLPAVTPSAPQPAPPATPAAGNEQPQGSNNGPAQASPPPPNFALTAADHAAYEADYPFYVARTQSNNVAMPMAAPPAPQHVPPPYYPAPPNPAYYGPYPAAPVMQQVAPNAPPARHHPGTLPQPARRRPNNNNNNHEPNGSSITFGAINTPTTMLEPLRAQGLQTEEYRELQTGGREGFRGRKTRFVGNW